MSLSRLTTIKLYFGRDITKAPQICHLGTMAALAKNVLFAKWRKTLTLEFLAPPTLWSSCLGCRKQPPLCILTILKLDLSSLYFEQLKFAQFWFWIQPVCKVYQCEPGTTRSFCPRLVFGLAQLLCDNCDIQSMTQSDYALHTNNVTRRRVGPKCSIFYTSHNRITPQRVAPVARDLHFRSQMSLGGADDTMWNNHLSTVCKNQHKSCLTFCLSNEKLWIMEYWTTRHHFLLFTIYFNAICNFKQV